MTFAGKPFLIMGVINVTPDSFSDGGEIMTPAQALDKAGPLLDAGADILDCGAESTRPGSLPVSTETELDRVVPIIEALHREFPAASLSIDSRKDKVFTECAKMGARWFNRVGPVPEPETLEKLATVSGGRLLATHMHRDPQTMQDDPLDSNSVTMAIDRFFRATVDAAVSAGWQQENLWLDPGVGFGKSVSANLAILGSLTHWTKSGQIMIGVSRKSFIGKLFNIPTPKDRDPASKIIETVCIGAGVGLIRTHDVPGLAEIRQRMMEGG